MAVRLRVRDLAASRGINQAALAREAKLGTTTVYELWRNLRAENVRVGTLIAVARVLGVPWHALVEITDDEGATEFRDHGAGIRQTLERKPLPAS